MTEIATVDTSSEVAVTRALEQSLERLTLAVEWTGPGHLENLATLKAEFATVAEATKQLGLSKDIQDNATEMVRRGEFEVRRKTKAAQESGEVAERGNPQFTPNGGNRRPSPASFFNSKREYEDANAMADLSSDEFDEVLAEARTEGNLSRANVAAKAKARRQPARPRRAAEISLNTISSLADRAARETQKLTADQIRRVKPNAAEWIDGIRNSIEVLQDLVNSLEEN